MREIEQLLEFHRIRDLYTDSIGALDKLAVAAANFAAVSASARGAAATNRYAGSRNGAAHQSNQARTARRGKRGVLDSRLFPSRGSASAHARAMAAAATAAEGRTPEQQAAAAKQNSAAIEEAAGELGIKDTAPGGPTMRRVLAYAACAWAEYNQVVRKYEAAQETLTLAAARADEAAAHATTPPGGKNGRGSSFGAPMANEGTPLRRSLSDPTFTSQPSDPSPLALSLSMISSHAHDDDDEGRAEHEEW
jgi:hypothetical protein